MTDENHVWRLLWAEADPTTLPRLRDEAARLLNQDVLWLRAQSLEEALGIMAEERLDLVLLDLDLPGADGLTCFQKIRSADPSLPILTLAGEDDPAGTEVLKLGALDSLPKSEQALMLISHAIRLGVHNARLQRELQESRDRERELRQMAALTREPSAISSAMYGRLPLARSAPEALQRMTDAYGHILDMSVEQLLHEGDVDTSLLLRQLSDELGGRSASPRDVVELHTRSLRLRLQDARPKRARALIKEGRVIVLELMGNLATFYRTNRAFAQTN